MHVLLLVALALSSLASLSSPARAAPRASDLVRAELVAEPRAVAPGQTFTVGIRLSMAEHWHTYWLNPGDSGLATEIDWNLPPGFTAGPIQWPTPSRIPVSHLLNYGYEGETTLLVDVTAPSDMPVGRPAALKAQVRYLVCERECIPGEAALSTSVPTTAAATDTGPDPFSRYVFETARASLPQRLPGSARLSGGGDTLTLTLEGVPGRDVTSAYFFPASETAIEHAAPQTLARSDGGISLTLTRSALATGGPPSDLPGVLVVDRDGGRTSFAVGTMPATVGGSGAGPTPAPSPAPADLSLAAVLGAAAFAFLGGLILNLMPCVFPVLSIKVMSLVAHSGHGPRAVRLNGFAYAAGVMASFLALAAILLAARAGGQEVGWGFQLQSPAVVVVLAFLLFAVGLSLSGVAEFGTSLAGRAGSVATGTGLGGSFATGVLASVVATPCTAPFMGAAVGYALTAPAGVALAVFAALGLGLAAPFLLLTFRPSLLSRLPRPGAWMDTLKQVLAFPVYASVAWLMFVLSQQVWSGALFIAMLGLVLLALTLWAWRLAAERSGAPRAAALACSAAALAAVAAIGWRVSQAPPPPAGTALAETGQERFTQARLDQLRAEGKPVFVNMTAAWCITCLVNERAALSASAVKARLAETGTVYLKGDWTNGDPEITRVLERHGRSGVPLYVVYPAKGEPVLLPQILTEGIVLDGLSGLDKPVRRADSGATRGVQP